MSSRRRPPLGEVRNVIASIAVSGFGTWGYNVGIAVYAYEKTHSAAWVAVVTVGRYLPAIVFSWLGAGLIDRLPRRALVIGADLGCAAIMAVLSALGAADSPVWVMTVVAALSSTAARIWAAAVLSLAADVVVESQLARASVLISASEAVATAAGSATASLLLLHFTPTALFAMNAVTFVLSAVLVSRVHSVPVRTAPQSPRGGDLSRSASAQSVVWPVQAARTIAALVYGMDVVLLTVVATRQFHAGTSGYGWLLAGAGVGGLLWLPARRRFGAGAMLAQSSTIGMLLYALPLLAFAADPPVAGGIATQIVRGIGAVFATSTLMGALQWAVPSAAAGRVFGATQSLVLVGTCVGSLVTAGLVHAVGFRSTVLIGAIAPCALQLALHPFLVRFDRHDAGALAALDPRLAVLRRLDLLRDASRLTLYEVADSVEEISVDRATVVVAEGEAADALYVLVTGSVEVTGGPPEARKVFRTMTGPDYFGEIGLLRRIPRTATVTALTSCGLWRIAGDRFLAAAAQAGESGALIDTMQLRITTSSSSGQLVPSP